MATTEAELKEKARKLVKEVIDRGYQARRGPVHTLLIAVEYKDGIIPHSNSRGELTSGRTFTKP